MAMVGISSFPVNVSVLTSSPLQDPLRAIYEKPYFDKVTTGFQEKVLETHHGASGIELRNKFSAQTATEAKPLIWCKDNCCKDTPTTMAKINVISIQDPLRILVNTFLFVHGHPGRFDYSEFSGAWICKKIPNPTIFHNPSR